MRRAISVLPWRFRTPGEIINYEMLLVPGVYEYTITSNDVNGFADASLSGLDIPGDKRRLL